MLVDFCIVSSVYVFAHLLRFEGTLGSHLQWLMIRSLPIILVIKLASFAGCGLYLRVWRYPDLSDILTISANLAGMPGISLNCGFTRSGLPIGLQIIGKPFDEATILRAAHAYEQATPWHKQRPRL